MCEIGERRESVVDREIAGVKSMDENTLLC